MSHKVQFFQRDLHFVPFSGSRCLKQGKRRKELQWMRRKIFTYFSPFPDKKRKGRKNWSDGLTFTIELNAHDMIDLLMESFSSALLELTIKFTLIKVIFGHLFLRGEKDFSKVCLLQDFLGIQCTLWACSYIGARFVCIIIDRNWIYMAVRNKHER